MLTTRGSQMCAEISTHGCHHLHLKSSHHGRDQIRALRHCDSAEDIPWPVKKRATMPRKVATLLQQ